MTEKNTSDWPVDVRAMSEFYEAMKGQPNNTIDAAMSWLRSRFDADRHQRTEDSND